MFSQRAEKLINAILDGEASEEHVVELQRLITDDENLIEELADRICEHRLLGLIHQPFDPQRCTDAVMECIARTERTETNAILDRVLMGSPRSDASPADDPPVTRPSSESKQHAREDFLRRVLVASLICALVISLGFLTFSAKEASETSTRNASVSVSNYPVATVLLEDDCVWPNGNRIAEGERLEPGIVELELGTLALRFDGGAELILVGPAKIDLQSAGSVAVGFGDVVVHAADGAEGFIVTTPTSEVVDLGTEFAVSVDPSGATEVHVLDGEVSYRGLDSPADHPGVARAGQGIAIDKRGPPRAVPMKSPRFHDLIRRAAPQPRTDLLHAYDGFNYSPGILPLNESTVGQGWSGPWRIRTELERRSPTLGQEDEILEIVHGEMKVQWPIPGGRLGALKLPAGGAYFVRPMKKGIDLGRSSVTFFSLMVRETKRPGQLSGGPKERLRLTFRSTDDYFGQAVSFGHSSGYRPTVRTGNGIMHRSPHVLPPEQTTLWIGKVVSRERGEDEIYFRVYGEDDVLDYAEPATWHVVTRGLQLDAHLDLVLLSSEGITTRLLDELRIGPTWRSVAPMNGDQQ